MTDLRLFDPPSPVPVAAPESLSADRRRTQQQQVSIANGRHPATRQPLLDPEWGYRCRDCTHAVRITPGNRSWWKCRRHRLGMSCSAASDIRVSWPACVLLKIDPEAAA
jgi:hypothetical protein